MITGELSYLDESFNGFGNPNKQGVTGWREAPGMLIDQQPERAALNLHWVLK